MALQRFENGAFGVFVAGTGIMSLAQGVAHGFQAGDARIQFLNVGGRQPLDGAAAPRRIIVQREQGGNLLQRKAHFPRMTDKAQPRDICLCVVAIARRRTRHRCQQPGFFIIAHLFGRQTGCLCRFAYLHATLDLNLG